MSVRVFVTGVGIISAIGKNSEEAFAAICSGKSGIGHIEHLDTVHKGQIPVGEVKYSNAALCEMAGVDEDGGYTRTALLGMIAAREAFLQAGIDVNDGKRTGLISATSVGGMDRSEKFFAAYLQDCSTGNIEVMKTHDCGDSTEKIADSLKIKDFVTTISTACSSSANAIMLGSRLLKQGVLDRVVVGGTDALTKFTINGFNTLRILDREHCRPFDKSRAGLNLGEGAGYLVLETAESAKDKEQKVFCEVKGYGNACDAFHQTASSPEGDGPYLSMQKALKMSGLNATDIDYINAHGTGTPNNDLSEGKAIERLFGRAVPAVSSTKPFTGHTLGACGGIEGGLAALALKNGVVYPNLNFKDKIEELNFEPVTTKKEQTLKAVLSNSFGFGGNDSTIIFSKV